MYSDLLELFRWLNLILLVTLWIMLLTSTAKLARIPGHALAKVMVVVSAALLVKDLVSIVETIIRDRPRNYSVVLTTVVYLVCLGLFIFEVRPLVKSIAAQDRDQ